VVGAVGSAGVNQNGGYASVIMDVCAATVDVSVEVLGRRSAQLRR
jgi:hypothetical protein